MESRPFKPWTLAALAFALAMAFPLRAGGGPTDLVARPVANPLRVAVGAPGNRCTRLMPTGGREVILNGCEECRVVNILRKRPGPGAPVTRSYNVPGGTTFPVPFRGPGRSRITSELPCEGDLGAAENLVKPGKKKKDDACVKLDRGPRGGIVLVNGCGACKAAVVERQTGQGRTIGRQIYELTAKTALSVPANGAAKVGVLAEVDCRAAARPRP